MIRVALPFTPPLDAAALLHHFAARAVPGVEQLGDDGAYTRSLRLPGGAAVVRLWLDASGASSEIRAELTLADRRDRDAAIERCRALLDLDSDPAAVAAALDDDPVLGRAVRAGPGRRVPGAVDAAELAVRAVLGQQISLAGAATAAGRLVVAHGEPLPAPVGAVTHLFPSAAALAAADPASLRMPRSRARSLVALSAALAAGDIDLRPGADRGRARAALLALPGIGPWTAEYVAMRALGDRDVFLSTDLGVRRALQRAGLPGDPRAAAALAERWRPYRSYAMQYLWALPAVPASDAGD